MKDLIDAWKKWVNENPTWFFAVIVIAVLFVVGAVLTIRYKEFGEFFKVILSPQIIIGLLVLYFISSFKAEISRLIDRIKTMKSSLFGFEAGDAPTPEDKANVPEPSKEDEHLPAVHGEGIVLDPTAYVETGHPEQQDLTDELRNAQEKATYWFFKYLSKYLTARAVEILNVIKRTWALNDAPPDTFAGYITSLYIPSHERRILDILQKFKLIDIVDGKIVATDLGRSFLKFYFSRDDYAEMSEEEIRIRHSRRE